jgi:hypothetical protein
MALSYGSVLFEANFGGKPYAFSAALSERKQAALLLSKARIVLADRIFDYAPVDRRAVEAVFLKNASSAAGLQSIVSSVSISSLERQLEPCVKHAQVPPDDPRKQAAEQKKIGYATSLYLYCAFKKFLGEPDPPPCGSVPAGTLRIVSNSPEWMAVKKANLAQWPAPEILSAMIGMLWTVVRKESELACKPTVDFDSEADSLFGGCFNRKSYRGLGEALSKIPGEKVSGVAERIAFSGDSVAEVEKLLFLKLFSMSGHSPYPGPDLLAETYPELKIPKPRGNFGGKKGKEK